MKRVIKYDLVDYSAGEPYVAKGLQIVDMPAELFAAFVSGLRSYRIENWDGGYYAILGEDGQDVEEIIGDDVDVDYPTQDELNSAEYTNGL